MNAKVRLPKGKGYIGAEYFGCINTGKRAEILHSRLGKYLVGTELAVWEAKRLCFSIDNKRIIETSSGRVYVYKHGSAAWAKWNELNDKVLSYNRTAKDEDKEFAYALVENFGRNQSGKDNNRNGV